METGIDLLKKHLIVALDVDTPEEALALADRLSGVVDKVKIGSRMFTAVGPSILDALSDRGMKVFLDLKYHDIPSVIGDAVRIVAERHPGVFLVTVHAAGGPGMVASAVEGASARDDLEVIAVTALTSLSPSETRILGVAGTLEDWVLKLAELALEAGANGLVCSANEVAAMRENFGSRPTIVTPGIRPPGYGREVYDDQARITTPSDAIQSGSTYLVMGRPVYGADDPAAVIRQMAGEL